MKSAKTVKMPPAAENAIDDPLTAAIAASFVALERVGEMDLTKAQRATIQRKIIADVVFGVF
jgi:hypothetical protein